VIRPRTLGTIRLAWSMVYEADRKHMTMILAATAITSVAIAGQLLAGRWILDALADDTTGARELVPAILVLGILVVIAGLSQAVAGELRCHSARPCTDGRCATSSTSLSSATWSRSTTPSSTTACSGPPTPPAGNRQPWCSASSTCFRPP
jgi:hypothetical protein